MGEVLGRLKNVYIYIYIYISSSHAASMDIPDPPSPLLPIVHRLWQVFRATSRILTELLYVCSRWLSCFCSAICRVHRSTSLMSSYLALQQCSACLFHLAWIVFVMGGRWPYSWCFVGCCLQDLFNIARNIFSSRFVSVQVVHPYSSIDTTAAWKKLRFFLSVRSYFHMIDSLSIAVLAFVSRVSMSF